MKLYNNKFANAYLKEYTNQAYTSTLHDGEIPHIRIEEKRIRNKNKTLINNLELFGIELQ
jgi:hypothetical protein